MLVFCLQKTQAHALMPCPKRLRGEQDPDYPDDPAVEGKRQRIAIQAGV
jgi:hypothetical protein